MPVRKDVWWYYTRTVEGRDYAIHCRLPVHGEGRDRDTPPGTSADSGSGPGSWPDEEVLLDENMMAGDGAYFDVANLAVSPGHTRLAYAVDTTGDERFTLRIRDLTTGTDLPGEIEGTSYGVAWANDDETVFYTRPDAANRTYQLWRHRTGTPAAPDTLVHEESDERLPPRCGADQGRHVHPSRAELQDHERGPCHPRRPTRCRSPRRRGTATGYRVPGRAPRGHVPPPHQRLGREFPGRRHTGIGSRSGPLDRGHPSS